MDRPRRRHCALRIQRHGAPPCPPTPHQTFDRRAGCAGEAAVVEEGLSVVDGFCRVKTGGRRVARAFLAPAGTPVEFAADGEYTALRLPIFTGTTLAVLEFAN